LYGPAGFCDFSDANVFLAYRTMAIFEDQEQINRKVLARFSDVSEKQFSSLSVNTVRIKRLINGAMT